jgi:hypothetical protein
MPSQFHTSISPGHRSDTWSVSEDFRAKVMKAATDMLGRWPFEHRSTFAGDRRRLVDFQVSRQQQMTRPAATGAKTGPFRSIIISDRMADHQSRSRSSVPRSGGQYCSGTALADHAGPAARWANSVNWNPDSGELERHRVGPRMFVARDIL